MRLFRTGAMSPAVLLMSATTGLAAATQVNITDPTATTRAARVEVGARLAVQEVPPANFFHASAFTITKDSPCTIIATAPSGKALVVREVRVNVYSLATAGVNNVVEVFGNTTCDGDAAGDINPPTVGLFTIPFDPGLGIAPGGGLSVKVFGTPQVELYTDGFTTVPGGVPAVGPIVQVYGRPRQR